MFSINNIAITIWDYPLSYIELMGTFMGFVSVFLAVKNSIWTWPTGILNELFFFMLFFQIQLYADMFLQVYFFAITVYGWYTWGRGGQQANITRLDARAKAFYGVALGIGTVCLWLFIKNIHLYFPDYFVQKAAYPLPDSFVTVGSILATILLAKRKLETWILWIIVDLASIGLYFMKGVQLIALEYVVFLAMAVSGFWSWKKIKNASFQ